MRNLLSAIALLTVSSPIFAQTLPSAPSSVCISDTTGPSSCAALSSGKGAKKWNPGHYARANTLGFANNAEERAYAFERLRNNPNIKGGLISVPWGTIEPRQGVYDFSPIDADLRVLKSMGKKLIIEVWWQKYGSSDIRDTRHFPQYIIDGGGVKANADGSISVQMQEVRWQDRYVELQRALAAKYDADPDVEQTAITETASTSAYGFLNLVPRVAALWPRTQVVLYPNWVDTPELARDLLAMMAPLGVGVGSPDIIGPPGMQDEDNGSRALRGAGRSMLWGTGGPVGDFGSVDYRGRIPVAYQYQALRGVGAADIIDYALDTLKATHLIWSMTEGEGAHINWSTGILPVIQAKGYRTVTTYPTNMPK